jgi:hypothetical protein
MNKKKTGDMLVEFTPLEKVESLYDELVDWYGDADKKELRVAAKFLLVSLEKFSMHGGNDWHDLVEEYIEILKNNPERFQKILESNRGELKNKSATDSVH